MTNGWFALPYCSCIHCTNERDNIRKLRIDQAVVRAFGQLYGSRARHEMRDALGMGLMNRERTVVRQEFARGL